jgi:hypothetical protein
MTDSLGNVHIRYWAYSATNNFKGFLTAAEAFDLIIYDGRTIQTLSQNFMARSPELSSTIWNVESFKQNSGDIADTIPRRIHIRNLSELFSISS